MSPRHRPLGRWRDGSIRALPPGLSHDTDFILNDATLLLYDPCVRDMLLPNGVQTTRESRPDLQEGRS
jgi:hypothetical protein